MNKISVIGLDLAKNVFQVHGIKLDGEFVIVLKGGKTIKGEEYLKNPGKYNGQLR